MPNPTEGALLLYLCFQPHSGKPVVASKYANHVCRYIAEWTKSNATVQEEEQAENQEMYTYIFVGFLVVLFLRSVVYMTMAIRASQTLHDDALSSMMACGMRFFDTQPIGRILNR